MKKKPAARTSAKEKLALPVLFLLILFGLVLFGILPISWKITETRDAIAQLEADLDQQRTLLPVDLSLQQRKEETLPNGISVNELEPLEVEDLADLPKVFEELAGKSETELVSVTPQVRSLQEDREMLQVDTLVRGEFLTFNTLLNQLNEMRFIETIESLAIDVTPLGQEMSLSIWLSIR